MSAGGLPSARRARVAAAALAAVAALTGLLPVVTAAQHGAMIEVPLPAVAQILRGDTPLRLEAGALVLDADRQAAAVLPLPGTSRLLADVEADAPLLLTWFPIDGMTPARAYGPPWRYVALRPGRRVLELDLLSTVGWSRRSVPLLLVEGTGRLRILGLRAAQFRGSEAEASRAHDLALIRGPDAIGHTTINFLAPLPPEPATGLELPELLALGGIAVFAAALAGVRLARRRWRPDLAAAAAALAMVGGWDALAAVRLVPALQLALEPDPELRIRDHYYFAPDMGQLAALARATLGPSERVGVLGGAKDWFGPQTLCFNLAPRPCAVLDRGTGSGHRISSVGRLRIDELDAVVALDPEEPLPAGFAPVAAVSRNAFVARRAP